MIQNAAQKISWAQNTIQTDITQKLEQADKDLKVAAPLLDAMGHSEAADAARAIQINVMPVLKKTNSLKKIGQQKIQESVQKVQEDIDKQSQEVKTFVQKKLDDNKEVIAQTEKVITQTIQQTGLQNVILKQAPTSNDKLRLKTEESEKDKSFIPINTQISKESPVRGILKKNNKMQSIASDFQQQSHKSESKSQKSYNLKDLDQLTQKAKGYYNKLIGKKVNTRLEYFNLLMQQLKLQPDENLLTQSKTKLKDKVWELSFQERRFISYTQLRVYLLEVIEFLNYHFLVLESVFKNLKLRFKSSTNSFHQLNLFFNQILQQLSGYENEVGSKNNLFKETQPKLNQLYTRQLAYQNSQKQNTENQIYLPQLNQIFTNLHNTNLSQLSNINNLKTMIKNELQPNLTNILNKDQQRVLDYILQVQGQRNISLEWFELTYQEYQKFEQLFKQNTQLVFENKPIQQDLFNQEYKLLCIQLNRLDNLRKFIEQHKIFGSFTAHLTDEMRKIDMNRTQQSLVQVKLFFQEYQKYFSQFSSFSSLFDNLNHIKECEESYQISQIIPEELQEVIKRVVNTQVINHEQYLAFASKFVVQKPPSYIEQNPLILKQLIISRDVAWERSLSLGVDYIKSICYITVDGFMLFFDQDWQQQGNNEPSCASNQLFLKDCNLSRSKSDPSAMNIIINLKGRLFNREKKYKIRFQDDQDIDALNFSITQFQQ